MVERRALPAAGGAHIWRIQLGEGDAGLLTNEERERAARIRTEAGQRRWIAARAALRVILARHLDAEPGDVPLRFGPHGKPELDLEPTPLRFNLSHSGDLALIALSAEREVGIDIEQVDPTRAFEDLACIGLDAESAAAVRGATPHDRPRLFYAAWTRREAIAKCLGVGLAGPQPNEPPVSVVPLDAGPGYAAALALAGEASARVHHLEFRD